MSQSIKKRVAALKIGDMTKKELLKLFNAIQTDIAALQSEHTKVVSDLQKISNNTASANNTVTVTAAAVTATLTA